MPGLVEHAHTIPLITLSPHYVEHPRTIQEFSIVKFSKETLVVGDVFDLSWSLPDTCFLVAFHLYPRDLQCNIPRDRLGSLSYLAIPIPCLTLEIHVVPHRGPGEDPK